MYGCFGLSMISDSVLYEYAKMNSPSYDNYCSSYFSAESPFLYGFHESPSFFPEFQHIDTFANSNSYDDIWLNHDRAAPTFLVPSRKKRKISENRLSMEYSPAIIEQLVTKAKSPFIYRDEFLLDVDKELPDVILASPCKENTRQSTVSAESRLNAVQVTDVNSSLPLYDDNPNTSFEDVLRKVKHEMDLRGDAVTYEDIEYLEDLLAGKVDYLPNYASSQSLVTVETEEEIICEDLTTYNEISCNLNSQQSAVSDSQSAIKKLLKNDSFKGNFKSKKSTEILSEMELTSDHLIYEHNYCASADYAWMKPGVENQLELRTPIDPPTKLEDTVTPTLNTKSFESAMCAIVNKSKKKPSAIPKKRKSTTKTRTKERETSVKEITTNQNILKAIDNKPELCPENRTDDVANASTVSESSNQHVTSPVNRPDEVIANITDVVENPELQPDTLPPAPDAYSTEEPSEPVVPKTEKKKLSIEEYLKKRAKRNITNPPPEPSQLKSNTETVTVPKIENTECTNKPDSKVPLIPIKLPSISEICSVVATRSAPPILGSGSVIPTRSGKITNTREIDRKRTNEKCKTDLKREDKSKERPIQSASKVEFKRKIEIKKDRKVNNKCSSAYSSTFSPSDTSHSLDNCDQYSSSGISSYHNSSVSSLCGSPFTVLDEKSNDIKYEENDRTSKLANTSNNVIKQSPFALNLDLLRTKDHHDSKGKHNKTKRHHKNSKSHHKRKSHRKNSYDKSDSCYEDDSDSSYNSERGSSRKRYRSTSSSSSDRASKRFHYAERSLSPRTYRKYAEWNYAHLEKINDPSLPYNQPPNVFYPPPPIWHPEYNFYHTYNPHFESAYYYDNRYYQSNMKDATGSDASKRILYVGNIENGLTKEKFCQRFKKFGTVKEAKLHFRDNASNFGFIYYSSVEEVYRAIEHGNDDPHLPKYSYGFGGRKTRTDGRNLKYDKNYTMSECVSAPVPHDAQEIDSYDLKLKQFKSDLRQKLTAQSYKYM